MLLSGKPWGSQLWFPAFLKTNNQIMVQKSSPVLASKCRTYLFEQIDTYLIESHSQQTYYIPSLLATLKILSSASPKK